MKDLRKNDLQKTNGGFNIALYTAAVAYVASGQAKRDLINGVKGLHSYTQGL